MKEYYADRFSRIFRYTKKTFLYCLLKTVCLVVGVPLYAVLFVLEMALTVVNMVFSVIPVLNVVMHFICKCLMFVCDAGYYLCVLPDIRECIEAQRKYFCPDNEETETAEEENNAETNNNLHESEDESGEND